MILAHVQFQKEERGPWAQRLLRAGSGTCHREWIAHSQGRLPRGQVKSVTGHVMSTPMWTFSQMHFCAWCEKVCTLSVHRGGLGLPYLVLLCFRNFTMTTPCKVGTVTPVLHRSSLGLGRLGSLLMAMLLAKGQIQDWTLCILVQNLSPVIHQLHRTKESHLREPGSVHVKCSEH